MEANSWTIVWKSTQCRIRLTEEGLSNFGNHITFAIPQNNLCWSLFILKLTSCNCRTQIHFTSVQESWTQSTPHKISRNSLKCNYLKSYRFNHYPPPRPRPRPRPLPLPLLLWCFHFYQTELLMPFLHAKNYLKYHHTVWIIMIPPH